MTFVNRFSFISVPKQIMGEGKWSDEESERPRLRRCEEVRGEEKELLKGRESLNKSGI